MLLGIFGGACSRKSSDASGTPAEAGTSKVDEPTKVPDDTKIVLERGRTMGADVGYRVTVTADGYARFEGLGEALAADAGSTMVAREKLLALVQHLRAAHFFDMKDDYPVPTTDQSSTIVTVTMGGKTKTIRDGVRVDLDVTAPPELRDLEEEIDKVAGTARWTKPQGVPQ